MTKKHGKLTSMQRGHKHLILVEFTFNYMYQKDLGRDGHFKRNGLLDQNAIGHRSADGILTLFWKFNDIKILKSLNIE